MALKKLKKYEIIFLAVVILIIPVILVYQLTKPDIVIRVGDDFTNQCFFGQTECKYMHDLGRVTGGVVEFRDEMELNRWLIVGEDVWCIHTERSVAVPVSNPVGVITQETEVSCNNIAVFDKDEWDLEIGIAFPDEQGRLIPFSPLPEFPEGTQQTFVFTMKGT